MTEPDVELPEEDEPLQPMPPPHPGVGPDVAANVAGEAVANAPSLLGATADAVGAAADAASGIGDVIGGVADVADGCGSCSCAVAALFFLAASAGTALAVTLAR
jgi:hypothetical protein